MLVADGLFETVAGETRLIAGRDRLTGTIRFPCPHGREGERFDVLHLPSTGTLWTWTVQRFAPKPPFEADPQKPFAPYAVGYVQLGDMLIVEGRIIVNDFSMLRLGLPMRVVTEAFTVTAEEEPVITYAFTPVEKGEDA